MSNSVESGRGMRRRSLLAATVLGSIGMISITPTPAFAFSGDNYPEPWRSASLGAYIDDWGYYTRYCTSWVAWALHDRNGFEMPRAATPLIGGIGHPVMVFPSTQIPLSAQLPGGAPTMLRGWRL